MGSFGGAHFINIDSFLYTRRQQIAALASRHQLPTIHPFRESVAAGGLMTYGPSFVDAWRQSGIYVGRILRGTKPADLHVLQPTKFELVHTIRERSWDCLDRFVHRADGLISASVWIGGPAP
jgi:putative ABC transport system substrate-binding protein